MAIKGYFFNAVLQDGVYDRTYDAEDVTSYLDLLVSDGVFPNPSSNLQVMAGTGMQVSVQPGQGWIQGHKMINTATLPLSIAAANALLARIDRVIFYVDYAAREMGIAVKTGTAAANPTPPALVRTATRYEMCLANVTVGKDVTSITQGSIQDTRGNSDLCGYVAGLIQQVDTSSLWIQYDAAGNQMLADNQQAFDDWFDQVRDTLASATMVQKLAHVITTTSATLASFTVTDYLPSYKYSVDILEIYVNGLRLNNNEFTQSGATVTLATAITHAGTQVELVVYKSIDGSDAETVVAQVQEMKPTVDATATGMYIATGTNDNWKLSEVVRNFLDGGNDYKQLKIDVYGTLAISTPAAIEYKGPSYWFSFINSLGSNTRRVIIDFANCERIIIDNTGYDNAVFAHAMAGVEILNAQAVMNNCVNAQMITGEAVCTNCAFWMSEASGGAGNLVGATRGKFDNCLMSVTGGNGQAYGFSADGGLLRLTNTEAIAYNASGTSAEAVAVQVRTGQTLNVLIMTNCSCPIRAKSGYKQSNVVKINSGFYALTANMLGMAAVKYNTGDGMTETGTMLVSK